MADIELGSIEIKTGANTSDKFKLPYNVLADPPDLSVYAKLAGGNTFSGTQVITGYLDIRGTAADKHLKTRGIGGSDGNGNSSDLYLQYSSDYKTIFGKTGNSSLNADGSITIDGKKAATVDQIPDVSGKANLNGGNAFTGDQYLRSGGFTFAGTEQDGQILIDTYDDGGSQESYFCVWHSGQKDRGEIFIGNGSTVVPVQLREEYGTDGQVFTSRGANATPEWTSPAIKSATLSGTTLYLTLS